MGQTTTKDAELADHVDLQSYMGKWLVVSRIGLPLESHFNESETYTLRPDGKIDVEYKFSTGIDKEEHKAKQLLWSKSENNSRLKVQMIWPLAFDYLIFDVDQANYQWCIVGSDNKAAVWIMSRQLPMNRGLYDELVLKAKNHGFDVSKLEICEHKGIGLAVEGKADTTASYSDVKAPQ